MVKAKFTAEDDALLAELGVEVEVKKVATQTPREERIIAGFEEIRQFIDEKGKLPSMAEGNDIFERIYATRLYQMQKSSECREILGEIDSNGLLNGDEPLTNDIDDDELLAELGISISGSDDITNLRHVKAHKEIRAAEEIANRTVCEDFEQFKPLFKQVQDELNSGIRETKIFRKDAGFLKADIKKGQFFILGGQMAYIAETGKKFITPNGSTDARLRVIFDNATESNMLLRSVQRALYKDEASRLISTPNIGPLFSGDIADDDIASGTIYILRSQSDHPIVKENQKILHKIGVTSGSIEKRIANAEHDATFLLAGVEIVTTYELFNINRVKLENIIHKFFAPARLDIEIMDRFGHPVTPKEWFLTPFPAIDLAVEKIKDGTINQYFYDVKSASIKLI